MTTVRNSINRDEWNAGAVAVLNMAGANTYRVIIAKLTCAIVVQTITFMRSTRETIRD
jgi:hypothetical protein